MRVPTRAVITMAATVAVAAGIGLPVAHGTAPTDPAGCSTALATGAVMTLAEHRDCVIAVAGTFLGGEDGTVAPGAVLLDDAVARYRLGTAPVHTTGAAAAQRTAWAGGAVVGAITGPEWTVDGDVNGDVAFVAARVHDTADGPVTHHIATRITVRDGLIWEVLENPTSGTSADGASSTRTAFHDVVALAGPMYGAVDMNAPDYDNPAYCSLVLGEQGDNALTPEQKHSCLIAIAATYVNAEGNSTFDSLTLFDPRFTKYSLGGLTNHHPGNGDTNRMDQITLSPTIRLIDNKVWTADTITDQVWITYDGYLPVSTDKPGFYVAERLTIRNGLIWEIMISPVVVDVPNSLIPAGPPHV
jgi:hypothetical protein